MEKLITISFPVYNVNQFVQKSLLSALEQSYPNIEYLIVDDCGTDNSMDIIRDLLNCHDRKDDVKIIKHPKNLGLGSVRNTSIENAHGEYIYFMDSDDLLDINCIEILYSYMKEKRYDFVAASHFVCDLDGTICDVKEYADEVELKGEYSLAKYIYIDKKDVFVYMWNKLFSMEFLRKFDIRCIHPFVEDDFFSLKLHLHTVSCRLISERTYYYYINPNSITSQLMNRDIPISTAKIYADNLCQKFEKVLSVSLCVLKYKMLLAFLNEAILRNGYIQNSSKIDDVQKLKLFLKIFALPSIGIIDFLKSLSSFKLQEYFRFALFLQLKYTPLFMKKCVTNLIFKYYIEKKISKLVDGYCK